MPVGGPDTSDDGMRFVRRARTRATAVELEQRGGVVLPRDLRELLARSDGLRVGRFEVHGANDLFTIGLEDETWWVVASSGGEAFVVAGGADSSGYVVLEQGAADPAGRGDVCLDGSRVRRAARHRSLRRVGTAGFTAMIDVGQTGPNSRTFHVPVTGRAQTPRPLLVEVRRSRASRCRIWSKGALIAAVPTDRAGSARRRP